MRQITEYLAVMHIGRSLYRRMNQLGLAIEPDMRLHTEIPLFDFLCLAHLRIAVAIFGRSRAGGIDDGCVYDVAAADLRAVLLQALLVRHEQLLAEAVGFQEMAKLEVRGLVRHRRRTQINAHEAGHRPGVMRTLYSLQVGEAEPALQEGDSEHPPFPNRPASGTFRLGSEVLDYRRQFGPRNDLLSLFERLLAACLLTLLLEALFRKCILVLRRFRAVSTRRLRLSLMSQIDQIVLGSAR
jgi:hypothetical protein